MISFRTALIVVVIGFVVWRYRQSPETSTNVNLSSEPTSESVTSQVVIETPTATEPTVSSISADSEESPPGVKSEKQTQSTGNVTRTDDDEDEDEDDEEDEDEETDANRTDGTEPAGESKQKRMLKDFVGNRTDLHELLDLADKGDKEAKTKFERRALALKYNETRASLPADTRPDHLVLHFIDEYTGHFARGNQKPEQKFMDVKEFVTLLDMETRLSVKLISLGRKVEKGECDFECLGTGLVDFVSSMMQNFAGQEM